MSAQGLKKPALTFKILAECTVSKARTALMGLPHHDVETPVFMPVGTQVRHYEIYRKFHLTHVLGSRLLLLSWNNNNGEINI